jgi:non-ribosomal peptide synthetase component F
VNELRFRAHELLWAGQGDAVTDTSGTLSYDELRARVANLADELRAAGLGPGDAVMIAQPRSANAIAAIFAVWAADAVAILIDPNWPIKRIANILDRTRASAVLADEALAALLVSSDLVDRSVGEQHLVHKRLTAPPGRLAPFSSEPNAAYVIFTSGTTSEPKGVVVSHHSLRNYLDWRTRSLAINPGFRVAAMAPMGVDVILRELVWPVTEGVLYRSRKKNEATRRAS